MCRTVRKIRIYRQSWTFVINPISEECSNFREDLAIIKFNGKYGFMDKRGHIVIPCKFEWAFDFNEELAVVKAELNITV